jgi:hypothetical protein
VARVAALLPRVAGGGTSERWRPGTESGGTGPRSPSG